AGAGQASWWSAWPGNERGTTWYSESLETSCCWAHAHSKGSTSASTPSRSSWWTQVLRRLPRPRRLPPGRRRSLTARGSRSTLILFLLPWEPFRRISDERNPVDVTRGLRARRQLNLRA